MSLDMAQHFPATPSTPAVYVPDSSVLLPTTAPVTTSGPSFAQAAAFTSKPPPYTHTPTAPSSQPRPVWPRMVALAPARVPASVSTKTSTNVDESTDDELAAPAFQSSFSCAITDALRYALLRWIYLRCVQKGLKRGIRPTEPMT